ncbi:MAG: hypothetical protein GQ569_10660, partial [Methylococcaceae bacterium]|nr:hypothetical protein [Methylococcaceae bacterium]
MKQVASLKYGVIFKKAFSKPEIFTAFVRDVLGIDIEIDHVETEKSFKPIIGKVDSHFDLFAEDTKNRIIVDIQHTRHEDHYDRFLHYHCVALLEQIASAKNYRPDLRVFTIVVLTSGDKHKTDVATIDFDPKNLKGEGLGEIQHKVIYLCPKYVNQETPTAYREWLEAIDDTLDEEVDENHYHGLEIQQVFKTIEKDGVTPEERAVMFEEYNQGVYEKTVRQEGLEEGLEQGQLKEKQTIARTMLGEGLAIELITKVTGL